MRKFVVGNWKMHGTAALVRSLVLPVVAEAAKLPPYITVVLCPPATLVPQVAPLLAGSRVKAGGQDCHSAPEGAYTGDISALMLKDMGCACVIAGHSERRQYHHETNQEVSAKASAAIKSGLMPIICVGETLSERQSGKAEEVVGRQVRESLPKEAAQGNFLLAYEPVWAIGSGQTPTPDDIRQMHAYIKQTVSTMMGGMPPALAEVLYGGSVKAANAKGIMALEGVDGVLVGGASLKAEEFCQIMATAVQ